MSSDTLETWLRAAEQGDAVACYNAGVVYQERDQTQAAIAYYEKALQLDPGLGEAHNNLGGIYKARNDFDQALTHYEKALYINPTVANTNNNIGVILQSQKNFKSALCFFKKALYLDPGCATAYYNTALIYEEQNEFLKAAQYYEQAGRCDSGLLTTATWSAELARIQHAYICEEKREEAVVRMQALGQWAQAHGVRGEEVVGFAPPFYVTYKETDNCAFLSAYGDACVALMRPLQPILPAYEGVGKKIRIGIVSDHFHGHSVWFAVLKGWYQHLDRERFEIFSFSLNPKADTEKSIVKEKSDYFVEGFDSVAQWRDDIVQHQVDVLIYSAVGMEWRMQQLASMRLAPVQMATWGHPETSGLSTIDYYLSAEDFEPLNAQQNYREKLLLLPRLGACYEPLQLPQDSFDMTVLQGTPDTRFIVAAGTAFKFDPQYDAVFIEIAKRAPRAKFIFFRRSIGVSDAFENRITKAFEDHGLQMHNHAVFVNAVKKPRFHALLRQAHLYWDTIGFSGFNTAMQALECGLPVVTLEGTFMRGRFAAAILKRAGLSELVAYDVPDYVNKVVRLVSDDSYRESVRHTVLTQTPTLYGDIGVVKGFQKLLIDITHPKKPAA